MTSLDYDSSNVPCNSSIFNKGNINGKISCATCHFIVSKLMYDGYQSVNHAHMTFVINISDELGSPQEDKQGVTYDNMINIYDNTWGGKELLYHNLTL